MKKVLSLLLSFVMALGVITGMDLSVFAADTEVESYEIYKANKYAELFDDIFVGTGSSSYARNFYNEMVNDDLLMGEIVAWESLHLIASPSYSLESGMITKYDYFKTVLFDLIISKSEDTIASTAQDNFEYLFEHVKNSKNSFIVSSAKRFLASEDGLTAADLKGMNLTDESKNLLLNGTRFADSVEIASDVMQILEWCDNVYDAIELTANYCALTDVFDGTKEVLQYIADDTSNNEDLRLAATACIECMGDSYTEVVNSMTVGAFGLFTDVAGAFIDEAWKALVATIPGGSVVLFALQGGRAIVNLLMSQDDKTKAYYQIEANVICEDAIIRAMSGLKNAYLNNKTEANAVTYLRAVEMYKDDILFGFDYSIDLLEVLVKANISTIIGTYNQGIELINDLYSYKSQKLNNFIRLEDAINTAHRNTYMPDYNTVINDYNNQETVEVESISLELVDEINIGDTGYIGNYIDVIKYPENANDLFVEDFVSLNEDVIKLNEYDFIEVVGTGECTIVCKQGTEFETTITVTVGETSADDTDDYLGDFSYTVNSDGTTATITGYSGTQSSVIIPSVIDGYVVTKIGNKAFQNCVNITSIIIPDSVTTILEYAFWGCRYLSLIEIPNSVKTIGCDAFAYCMALSYINVPESVKSIEENVFLGCTNLETIDVDSENRAYTSENGVLFNKDKTVLICYPAKKIKSTYAVPDSVVSIERYAFSYCKSLTSIAIPSSVISIGSDVFASCTNLETITVDSNNMAFTSQNGILYNKDKTIIFYSPESNLQISSYVVPNSVKSISYGAFRSSLYLESITIPDSVISIGEDAFCDCDNLNSVIIGDGVTSMGATAFYGCNNLVSVTIPNNVTSLGRQIFDDCLKLESITIPNSVTSIGSRAFRYCPNLKYIFYTGTESDWANIKIDSYNDSLTKATIHYNSIDHNFGDVIINEPTCEDSGVKYYECSVCGYVTNIETLPATGHSYGDWIVTTEPTCTESGVAKKICRTCGEEQLTYQLVDPSMYPESEHNYGCGITETYDFSYDGAQSLTLTFSSLTVTELGFDYIYIYDEKGELYGQYSGAELSGATVTLPGSSFKIKLTSDGVVDEYGFSFDSIIAVTELDVIKPLGHNYVNAECIRCGSSMYEYTISNNEVTILKYNGNETAVSIPDTLGGYSVVALADMSFSENTSITSINMPDTVTQIGDHVFAFCVNLKTVSLSSNLKEINSFAFRKCLFLEEINIPETVEIIGDCAFYGCTSLKDITIPDKVSNIGESIFSGCTNLEYITVGKAVSLDFLSSIYECENLRIINITDLKAYCDALNSCDELIMAELLEVVQLYYNGKPIISLVIPEGVTNIPCGAFALCKDLQAVTFTDDVREVGMYAFYGCSNLEMITLSENLEIIGDCAFYGCTSLKDITIPDKVSNIGESIFSGCTNLEYITVGKAVSLDFLSSIYECESLRIINITDLKAYCDALNSCNEPIMVALFGEGKQLYMNGEPIETLVIPEGETTIPCGAFAFCKDLKSVIINNNVTEIGLGAFYECTSLETIVIPDSVTTISEAAFGLCTELKSIVLGENIRSVSTDAFRGCIRLNSVKFAQTNISDVSDFFSFSSDSVKVSTDNPGGFISTGTNVNVIDSEFGDFTFTCIIKGDTNGDSICDVLDCFDVERASNGNSELSDAYAMAADSNSDDVVDITDYQAIVNKALAS